MTKNKIGGKKSRRTILLILLAFVAGMATTQLISRNADNAATAAKKKAEQAEKAAEAAALEKIEAEKAAAIALEKKKSETENTFGEKPEPAKGETLVRGILARDENVIEPIMRAGVKSFEADRALRSLKSVFDFRKARPGDRYSILANSNGQMVFFAFKTSPIDIYTVKLGAHDYIGKKAPIKTEKRTEIMEGVIETSLWDTLTKNGRNFELAVKLAEVFAWDIDFYADLRKGDTFHLIFEEQVYHDEVISIDRILAASYEGGLVGKKVLYYFDKKDKYYDYNGTSATKAFLRSPLKFTRISSRFGRRFHPILRKWHFHGGVDYAAPTGTLVQAVGDGVVTFTGRAGAAGNMIKIKHRGGYESLYLHLSKIHVKKGQKVTQKKIIGKVGSTGRSTGPHLDFRLKHRGKLLNPLKHVAPRTKPLKNKELDNFRIKISKLKEMLDGHDAESEAAIDEKLKN